MTNIMKDGVFIKLILAVLLAMQINTSAGADSLGSTEISYSTGKRSQTDGIEERDLSGDYSFYKYGLTVKATPLEDFYYRIGYRHYHKKFDSSNDRLDNRTNTYNAYFSLPLKKTDDASLKFNIDYGLRTKRYKNSPNSEYDNNRLGLGFDMKLDKDYSLKASAGINHYDYIKKDSSNQLKSFIKINPSAKLLDGTLSLSGYYKRNWVDNSGSSKDYSEDSVSVRASLKLDTPLLYKIGGHFGYGRSDTRDDEEDREDSLRYEYRLWDINTNHKINNSIDTQMAYGQVKRDYFTSINSYDSWFLKNKTKIALMKKDPFNMDLLLGYEHREAEFSQNDALNYNKNAINSGFSFSERGKWSVKPGFAFTHYKYPPLSTRNEKQYKADITCKKYIGSTDNAVELGYWYKWKEYKYRPSIEQWAVNASYSIKF
jgi:hypothetical protein